MVADASIDFAFSFDSLVHAEADILESYASELARVLKPNAIAFLHHSNLATLTECLIWDKLKRRSAGVPIFIPPMQVLDHMHAAGAHL